FFSSRRRHTRFSRDWSSDVCSSDLVCVVHRGGEEGGSAGTARLRPLPRATARTRRSRPGPPGAGARVEGDGGGNLVEEDTLRVAEKPLEPRAVGEAEARRGEADEPATVPSVSAQGVAREIGRAHD